MTTWSKYDLLCIPMQKIKYIELYLHGNRKKLLWPCGKG